MLFWAHIRFFAIFVKVCVIEKAALSVFDNFVNWFNTKTVHMVESLENINDSHEFVRACHQTVKVVKGNCALSELYTAFAHKMQRDADEAVQIAEWLGYV